MRSVGIVCGYDLNDDLHDYVKSVAPLIARERSVRSRRLCVNWEEAKS